MGMECKRVLFNSKIIFFLMIAIFINGYLYIQSQIASRNNLHTSIQFENAINQDMINLSIKEKETYLINLKEEYTLMLDTSDNIEYITDVLTDIEQMLNSVIHVKNYKTSINEISQINSEKSEFSIYADVNSYEHKQNIKAVNDYKNLNKADVSYAKDRGITSIIQSEYTSYLILIFIFIIVLSFFDERKKGLWNLIYSTKKGRCILAAKRISILFISVNIIFFILFTEKCLLSLNYYGYPNLTRTIQSIPEFGNFTLPMDILTFILVYYITNTIFMFVTGCIIYITFLIAKSRNIAILFISLFLAAEYAAYRFIEPHSIYNIFKYINIFYYINPLDIFTNYRNLNIFGTPVGRTDIIFLISLFGLTFLPTAIIIVTRYIRPENVKSRLEKIITFMQNTKQALLYKMPFAIIEIYKILIGQKALVILAVFFILTANSIELPKYTYKQSQSYIKDFYTTCYGNELSVAQNYIDNFERQTEIEQLEYGTTTSINTRYTSINEMKERVSYIQKIRDNGKNAWVIDDTGYFRMFSDFDKLETECITILTFLILLISGIFSYEKRNYMENLIKASACRKKLFFTKLIYAILIELIICGFIYGTELYILNYKYGITSLDAPILSCPLMEKLPFNCSIGTFLILLYVYRFILLSAVTGIISAISMLLPHEKTIIISGILFVIPAVLNYIGFTLFEKISCVEIINVTKLIINIGGIISFFPGILMICAGGVCWKYVYNRVA